MNVTALQQWDKLLGVPGCFLLTLIRRCGAACRASTPPRRILIVKLAEQGSTVLAYPAVRCLVERVGRENVFFLVLEDNRFILDVMGVVPAANVATIRATNLGSLLVSTCHAIRQLRKLRLDAAIDMEFFSRASAVLSFLSGAAWRVGFHAFHGGGPYRGDLMTHRLVYNPGLHTAQTFRMLVEALNWDPAELPAFGYKPPVDESAHSPRFTPGPGELAALRALVHRAFGRLPPLILLNPNTGDLLPLRRWPGERYVELAKRLLDRYPEAGIVFTGAPTEAQATEALARAVGSSRCVSLAGQTTLRQLLVLYHLGSVLVTNDSGPAHFATLTPIQVVTLFGPETPTLYAARSPRNTVLWAGIACSPCFSAYNNRQSACRHNVCLERISVDEVFTKVCEAYTKRHTE